MNVQLDLNPENNNLNPFEHVRDIHGRRGGFLCVFFIVGMFIHILPAGNRSRERKFNSWIASSCQCEDMHLH